MIKTAVLCIVHSGALGFNLDVNEIVTDGYSLWQSKFEKKLAMEMEWKMYMRIQMEIWFEIKKLIETEMWIEMGIRNEDWD
jgi:hypothetical protein